MNYTTATLQAFAKYSKKDIEYWQNAFSELSNEYGLVSYGDKEYPYIVDKNRKNIQPTYTTKRDEAKTQVPNRKNAPHFLLYRGDISLLNKENFYKNVAVIGVVNPSDDIISREKAIVKHIVANGGNIVSGLAKGCDTISHEECLRNNGKTIAVLPSRLDKVIPPENNKLANSIVARGGLLVTEYYDEPLDKWESANRFIERDRLQAYFSNSIILIASYRHPEKGQPAYPQDGIKRDSGSRHAMKIAENIGRNRFVMLNDKLDFGNEIFDLNRDLAHNTKNPATILTERSIDNVFNQSVDSLPMF